MTAPILCDMVSALYDADVRSTDDLDAAMGEATSPDDRERLGEAAELALSLGFLPERRPFVYGEREPRTETIPGLEPWVRHAHPSYGAYDVADGLYFGSPSLELSRMGPELDFGR